MCVADRGYYFEKNPGYVSEATTMHSYLTATTTAATSSKRGGKSSKTRRKPVKSEERVMKRCTTHVDADAQPEFRRSNVKTFGKKPMLGLERNVCIVSTQPSYSFACSESSVTSSKAPEKRPKENRKPRKRDFLADLFSFKFGPKRNMTRQRVSLLPGKF